MRRAALVLLVVPLVLAACGGGSTSSSGVKLTPSAYVVQAAKKSATAKSEHVELKASASVQGQPVGMTGGGDFDNEARQGTMTMHANLQGLDMQIDEVLDRTAIYMKSPFLSAALPKGKTWMKLDLAKVAKSQGVDLSSIMGQSPTDSFSQLEASGHVTAVGDETIGGTQTTHYRGRIDTTKLPAAVAKLKVKYQPYDVWIGKDDGYVRKMRVSYTASQQTIAMTMSFSNFGKDVRVEVPAAADAADMTDQSLQGLGG